MGPGVIVPPATPPTRTPCYYMLLQNKVELHTIILQSNLKQPEIYQSGAPMHHRYYSRLFNYLLEELNFSSTANKSI